MTKWEKQKAYMDRRAADLEVEMNAAIEAYDVVRFNVAYEKALYYMPARRRKPYYMRMLEKHVSIRNEAKRNA